MRRRGGSLVRWWQVQGIIALLTVWFASWQGNKLLKTIGSGRVKRKVAQTSNKRPHKVPPQLQLAFLGAEGFWKQSW